MERFLVKFDADQSFRPSLILLFCFFSFFVISLLWYVGWNDTSEIAKVAPEQLAYFLEETPDSASGGNMVGVAETGGICSSSSEWVCSYMIAYVISFGAL